MLLHFASDSSTYKVVVNPTSYFILAERSESVRFRFDILSNEALLLNGEKTKIPTPSLPRKQKGRVVVSASSTRPTSFGGEHCHQARPGLPFLKLGNVLARPANSSEVKVDTSPYGQPHGRFAQRLPEVLFRASRNRQQP